MEKYVLTYLPTYLPTYLSTDLHIYVSTYLSIYILTFLPTYLPTCLPACLQCQYPFSNFLLSQTKLILISLIFLFSINSQLTCGNVVVSNYHMLYFYPKLFLPCILLVIVEAVIRYANISLASLDDGNYSTIYLYKICCNSSAVN